MDDEVVRFRRAAARENRGRLVRRRYSVALQAQAAAYWRERARAGEGLRAVAATLGVAPGRLRRWAQDACWAPVQVVPEPAARGAGLVVVVGGVRVEGCSVEIAAALVARLR